LNDRLIALFAQQPLLAGSRSEACGYSYCAKLDFWHEILYFLYEIDTRKLKMSMTTNEPITNYMSSHLIKFQPETDIHTAIKTFLKYDISGAPVINKKGELLGILSEKDCIRTILDGPYNQAPGGNGTVGDFMSTEVKTVSGDMTVIEVAYEFVMSNYRRFPVIQDGKLVGQVSRRDILQAILKMKPKIKHTPSTWIGREPQF